MILTQLHKSIIIHKLMNTRSHLGSTQKVVYSYFQSYLYGFRNEMNIIHLEITLICLKRACYVIENIVNSKGHILFINTNPEYNEMVKYTSLLSKQSVVNHKWTGGLLTNWNHMQYILSHFQSILNQFVLPETKSSCVFGAETKNNSQKKIISEQKNLKHNTYNKNSLKNSTLNQKAPNLLLKTKSRTSDFLSKINSAPNTQLDLVSGTRKPLSKPSQKVVKGFTFDLPQKKKQMKMCFEGLRAGKRPDCVVLFNGTQNANAINEAFKLQIPIISLVDSNMDNRLLSQITYPIPANENSMEFIYLLCNCILKTIFNSEKNSI